MQYLHQVDLLHILPALSKRIIVPISVVGELASGRRLGLSVPEPERLAWVEIKRSVSAVILPLVTDLGTGETEVLALARENEGSVAVIDDGLARRVAQLLGLPLTGTLGLLLDAKRKNLIPMVKPVLDELDALRFRLSSQTRTAVLRLAGEE